MVVAGSVHRGRGERVSARLEYSGGRAAYSTAAEQTNGEDSYCHLERLQDQSDEEGECLRRERERATRRVSFGSLVQQGRAARASSAPQWTTGSAW